MPGNSFHLYGYAACKCAFSKALVNEHFVIETSDSANLTKVTVSISVIIKVSSTSILKSTIENKDKLMQSLLGSQLSSVT